MRERGAALPPLTPAPWPDESKRGTNVQASANAVLRVGSLMSDAQSLYLDLMKKSLTYLVYGGEVYELNYFSALAALAVGFKQPDPQSASPKGARHA